MVLRDIENPYLPQPNMGFSREGVKYINPQRIYPELPDDDEAYSIIDQAYEIAERRPVPNGGDGYFESLLARAVIALCRRKYQNGP